MLKTKFLLAYFLKLTKREKLFILCWLLSNQSELFVESMVKNMKGRKVK